LAEIIFNIKYCSIWTRKSAKEWARIILLFNIYYNKILINTNKENYKQNLLLFILLY